jgi:hypothetical protein
MAVFLAVIITILVISLLDYFFVYAAAPYTRKVIDAVIDISCYVNTFHYEKDEEDRVRIGQDRLYKSLFKDRESSFRRKRTDFIFWIFYTKIFNSLLNCIPVEVNICNNRTLAEGESRGIGTFLDKYQEARQRESYKYATDEEKTNLDCVNCCAEEIDSEK